MRTSSAVVAVLLLAGCDNKPDQSVIANVEAEARGATAEAGDVDCAPPGSDGFRRVCTLDRSEGEDGAPILTVRQPDGGFHRLRRTDDGRGVIAADGSEAAQVSIVDPATIEVAIGGGRYRLPAKIGPLPPPR